MGWPVSGKFTSVLFGNQILHLRYFIAWCDSPGTELVLGYLGYIYISQIWGVYGGFLQYLMNFGCFSIKIQWYLQLYRGIDSLGTRFYAFEILYLRI